MNVLRLGTAVTVKIGPFIQTADGYSAHTSLSLTQADIRVSKNGGNIAQKDSATAPTHDELGVYDCALSTTDTGTAGVLRIDVQKTGAAPVWHEWLVVDEVTYDSLVPGSDVLQVDQVQLGGADAATQIGSIVSTEIATLESDVATIDANVDTILAAVSSGGVAIATATMQAIADEILKRGVAGVEDTANANSLAALVLATFFGEISGTDFNVYKTDGVTLFASSTVTTDENALPVTAVGV